MYLASGMADIAAETGDPTLLAACHRLWDSTTLRKMYVTGAVGARHTGEAFGNDYELPNESAYAETCANIALAFFAHRMLQIEADGRYANVMERALYNGVLSGMSFDGKKYFYVNPLASAGGHHRQPFFDCACCPTNVARLLASLGAYAYSAADAAAYVHLYAAGQAKLDVGGQRVTVRQETRYPWDGEVALVLGLAAPATFNLNLRIPGWCHKYTLAVNGNRAAAKASKGYVRLRRRWADGDTVRLSLVMPVERIVAHPSVADDAGKVAIQRGPLVYCLEQCDHAAPVPSIILPDVARLTPKWDKRLLGGCVVIEGMALAPATAGWKGALYRRAGGTKLQPVRIRAVPYCLWDNRRPGPMAVWLPRA
jgi:hypothetical protein